MQKRRPVGAKKWHNNNKPNSAEFRNGGRSAFFHDVRKYARGQLPRYKDTDLLTFARAVGEYATKVRPSYVHASPKHPITPTEATNIATDVAVFAWNKLVGEAPAVAPEPTPRQVEAKDRDRLARARVEAKKAREAAKKAAKKAGA